MYRRFPQFGARAFPTLWLTAILFAASPAYAVDAEVDLLQQQISELRGEGRYEEASVLAKRVERFYIGDLHTLPWQIEDTRHLIETLEVAAAMASNDRERLQRADHLAIDAESLWKHGDYEACREAHEERVAIMTDLFDAGHADVIDSMIMLALTHWKMGRHAMGESIVAEAIDLAREHRGRDNPLVGRALNVHGLCCMAQSKFDLAGPSYRAALELLQVQLGPKHTDIAACLNNLGALSGELGDWIRAEAYYKLSLAMNRELLGDDNLKVARGMHNLGFAYMGRGDYLSAVAHLENALELRVRHLGDHHPDVGLTTQILAQVYTSMGDREKGHALCKRALDIRIASFGENHPLVAWNYRDLSGYELFFGNLERAEEYAGKALAFYEESDERMEYARGLMFAGRVAMARGDFDTAESAWKLAVQKAQEGGGANSGSYLAGYAQLRALQGDHDDAIRILTAAASDFEQQRLINTNARRRSKVSNPYRLLASEYLRVGRNEDAWPALERSLGRAMIDQLSESAGHEEGWVHSLASVQQALESNVAVVGWLDVLATQNGLPAAAWAYVIRDHGPVEWTPLIDDVDELQMERALYRATKLPITPRAPNFRESLRFAAAWPTRLTDTQRIDAAANALWRERVEPIERYLAGVDRLVVIQSRAMAGLPVDALIDDNGKTLCERFEITHAVSATAFRWHYDHRRGRDSIDSGLLVGAPPFSEAHLKEAQVAMAPVLDATVLRSALGGNAEALSLLPALPESRTEVNEIAAMLSAPTVLVGRAASEDAINGFARAGQLGQYDVLHFATHAIVDPYVPDVSALILSQVDLPDPITAESDETLTDGMLSVSEIFDQWDLDADLVTLSGCQTAVGRYVAGEGYEGFAHAFFYAGAQSVLVSLWDVDDTATRMLMTRFYENLTGKRDGIKMTKAGALREAKLWLRHYEQDGYRPFAHPAYWASFILVGDPS